MTFTFLPNNNCTLEYLKRTCGGYLYSFFSFLAIMFFAFLSKNFPTLVTVETALFFVMDMAMPLSTFLKLLGVIVPVKFVGVLLATPFGKVHGDDRFLIFLGLSIKIFDLKCVPCGLIVNISARHFRHCEVVIAFVCTAKFSGHVFEE